MNTLKVETPVPRAQDVVLTEDSLTVDLIDGRTVTVPLAWYPRLLHGQPEERNNWRLTGKGEGIHWLSLDEDISVENLLLGKPSGESQPSFKRWLEKRKARDPGSGQSHRNPPNRSLHPTPHKGRRR